MENGPEADRLRPVWFCLIVTAVLFHCNGAFFLPVSRRARSIGHPPDVENRTKIALQASLTAAFARFSTPCTVSFHCNGAFFLPVSRRARSIGHPPDVENRTKIALQASLTAIFVRFSTPCELVTFISLTSSCHWQILRRWLLQTS